MKVIDPVTGNSCWGHIRIEDKLAPVLTCPGDLTLDCTASTLLSKYRHAYSRGELWWLYVDLPR
ncbi:MAG: hypothetical protein IPM86_03050 [Saprospiraceae bacterium]|nr:hypothetical protein [Saprospiraceae bacterium]